MSRAFYSEFVSHCLRFYARYEDRIYNSEAEKHNWIACHMALKSFTKAERKKLLTIYKEGDTIPNNVYQVSKKSGVHQDVIWGLVRECEKRVAKYRGLL